MRTARAKVVGAEPSAADLSAASDVSQAFAVWTEEPGEELTGIGDRAYFIEHQPDRYELVVLSGQDLLDFSTDPFPMPSPQQSMTLLAQDALSALGAASGS